MEMEQLVKMLIAVVVLVILVWMFRYLLVGKGGSILEGIGRLFRFGR